MTYANRKCMPNKQTSEKQAITYTFHYLFVRKRTPNVRIRTIRHVIILDRAHSPKVTFLVQKVFCNLRPAFFSSGNDFYVRRSKYVTNFLVVEIIFLNLFNGLESNMGKVQEIGNKGDRLSEYKQK